MKNIDPDIGEQYRNTVIESMTEDEKQRFKQTWDQMSEKEKKLSRRNIWKFLKRCDISMRTIRKIHKKMQQNQR